MPVRLLVWIDDTCRVTEIAYDLINDHGERVRTWVGSPEADSRDPHAGFSDLLSRLALAPVPLSLFNDDGDFL